MTTEEQRVAAVEAQRLADDEKRAQKREADKIRKREQRARERLEREQVSRHQSALLAAEEASADAVRRKQERDRLILQELKQPISPDEFIEGEGESYWRWFLSELDIFLMDFESRYSDFEELYNVLLFTTPHPNGDFRDLYDLEGNLMHTTPGRLALEYLGIELPPKPEPIVEWQCSDGYVYKLPQSERDDLIARKVVVRSPDQAAAYVKYIGEEENRRQIQRQIAEIRERTELKNEAHRQRFRELEKRYLAARRIIKEAIQENLRNVLVADNARMFPQGTTPPSVQETPLPLLQRALQDRRDASWSE